MVNIAIRTLGLVGILAASEAAGFAYAADSQRSQQIESVYRNALSAIGQQDYARAEGLLEQVISYGPNDNSRFGSASKWMRRKLPERLMEDYERAMKAEKAAADVLQKQARKLPANSKDRKEMIERSQRYLRHISQLQAERKEAADTLISNAE